MTPGRLTFRVGARRLDRKPLLPLSVLSILCPAARRTDDGIALVSHLFVDERPSPV